MQESLAVDEPPPEADPIGRHLLSGERILWTGRPDPNRLLTLGDVFLIPFSLMWGGFAVFWELGVLGVWSKSGRGAPGLFVLWGIPFVVVGQYFIWGRFVYKHWDRRRTVYAVTNQRVLVLRGSTLQSMFIIQLPEVTETTRSDGTGTLDFGSLPFGYGFWANTGMDWFSQLAAVGGARWDVRGAPGPWLCSGVPGCTRCGVTIAPVNSIRPRSTHGVTLRIGRGGQFCPPQAIGSEPA